MIVDTSFLISFYNESDSNHEKAVQMIKEKEHLLLLPEYVIAETSTVLLYKQDLKTSKEFLKAVEETRTMKILHVGSSDFHNILEIFKNQKNQLSFVDASIVYYATKMRLDALCFDKNINKEIKRLDKEKF